MLSFKVVIMLAIMASIVAEYSGIISVNYSNM